MTEYFSSKKFHFATVLKTGIVLVLFFSVTAFLVSRPNGYTGVTSSTSSGCSCHSSSANSATTVSITSGTGSFTVLPGSVTNFSIKIANATKPQGSIDIGVKTAMTGETNVGTLAPATGSGLKLSSSELTQSSAKSLTSGSVYFDFTWTAPTTPGTYYIRAIGLAVDGNGSANSGDQWNRLPAQTIVVSDGVNVDEQTTFESLQSNPSPSIGSVNLEYFSISDQKAVMNIFDQLGNNVKNFSQINLVKGTNSLTWDLKDLNGNSCSPGIYFVVVNTNSDTKSLKIVVGK